jgi:hypothetical protein
MTDTLIYSDSAVAASQQFMDIATRASTLYDLSADYLSVLDLLEQTDDDPALLEQALDAIAGKITQKADNIVALTRQLEGMAELRAAEAKRMKALADADAKRADRLRDYLLRHLVAIGAEHVETARFRIAVRQNPAAVQVVDADAIPADFIRTVTTTSVDKRAILAALKDTGEVVPGIEIVRGTRLEVR